MQFFTKPKNYKVLYPLYLLVSTAQGAAAAKAVCRAKAANSSSEQQRTAGAHQLSFIC
jgi:hypothetical protein